MEGFSAVLTYEAAYFMLKLFFGFASAVQQAATYTVSNVEGYDKDVVANPRLHDEQCRVG